MGKRISTLRFFYCRLLILSVYMLFELTVFPAQAGESEPSAALKDSEWILIGHYIKGNEEKSDKDKLYCRFRSFEPIRGAHFCCNLHLKIDMSLVKPYRTSHERYFPRNSLWILYLDITAGESPVVHLTRAPGAMVPYSEQALKEAIITAYDGVFKPEVFERLKVEAETSGGVIIPPR